MKRAKKDKLYVFKVALSHDKKIWRRIEILGSQTLDLLHQAIFVAFDRFDPHMYSFYLPRPGAKLGRNFHMDSLEYTHPYAVESDMGFGKRKLYDAAETKISRLKLEEKDKFKYLFDFGDEWLHEITLEKILDVFPEKDYPAIVKKTGESPPQYPDPEYPDDEYDDEDELHDEDDIRDMPERNRELLSQFRAYLESRNLSDRTVNKHVSNIDFFVNEFLLHDDHVDPREGIETVDYFLGFWFIKKTMWASEATIKENITSLKHFYTFMYQKGEITKEELDNLKQQIKESKEEWLETVRKYDDPDVDFDDIW